MVNTRNDRIGVRLRKELKELIKLASGLKGFKNLSDFVIFCISTEANKIIVENDLILKSIKDKKLFLKALLNPPKPNNKLKKAQINYVKFTTTNGN